MIRLNTSRSTFRPHTVATTFFPLNRSFRLRSPPTPSAPEPSTTRRCCSNKRRQARRFKIVGHVYLGAAFPNPHGLGNRRGRSLHQIQLEPDVAFDPIAEIWGVLERCGRQVVLASLVCLMHQLRYIEIAYRSHRHVSSGWVVVCMQSVLRHFSRCFQGLRLWPLH